MEDEKTCWTCENWKCSTGYCIIRQKKTHGEYTCDEWEALR